MLKQRLITVAVVLPLLLGMMFFAPVAVWGVLAGLAAAAGALEWARLAGLSRRGRIALVLAVASSCAVVLAGMLVYPRVYAPLAQSLYALALVFWAVAVPAWLHFRWRLSNRWLLAAAGWVVLVPSWLAVTSLQSVPLVLFLTLGAVWIADTAAYFAGKRYGRHKLAPEISPGKTVEGVAGAFVAVLVYAAIVAEIFLADAVLADRIALLLFAMALTVFSVAGDLFESWIKRQAGAKDSGDLLPGHGGVLDRIDSLTAALPFAALFLARFST
ncbi:MAG: phosphatidate cytidylyltransferase [Burkholderiales bacterium]